LLPSPGGRRSSLANKRGNMALPTGNRLHLVRAVDDLKNFLFEQELLIVRIHERPRNSFKIYSQSFLLPASHFELAIHFLDLRSLLFQLVSEPLYLLLLLRDCYLQVLNFEIEHILLGGVGNGFGRHRHTFERKSTVGGDRA
jgi:hypothetical protein